ncbi:hypothetical protein J4Q44_G00133940 [Coregonus suidteri]|uniref:Uncharacterized protein n=1 Tax=Coregonus suidteri TaxID=861788 RepID=A0AAN8LP33_9TELE
MLRGVKTIQQSMLLQEEKINSVFLLYLMSIPSFCILAVAALALENWAVLESPMHYDHNLWLFILLSCLGSVMYNLASCCVITLTSAVTLHILGNLSVVGQPAALPAAVWQRDVSAQLRWCGAHALWHAASTRTLSSSLTTWMHGEPKPGSSAEGGRRILLAHSNRTPKTSRRG